jgi:hypothetical protein
MCAIMNLIIGMECQKMVKNIKIYKYKLLYYLSTYLISKVRSLKQFQALNAELSHIRCISSVCLFVTSFSLPTYTIIILKAKYLAKFIEWKKRTLYYCSIKGNKQSNEQ